MSMINRGRGVFIKPMIFLICGAVAGAFWSYLTEPVYIADGAIKVGRFGVAPDQDIIGRGKILKILSSREIEKAGIVGETLRAQYNVPDARKGFLDLPYLYFIETRDGEILRLSARGRSKQEAIDFLNQVMQKVVEEHKRKYDKAVQALEKERHFVRDKLQALGDAGSKTTTPKWALGDLERSCSDLGSSCDSSIVQYAGREIVELFFDLGRIQMPYASYPTEILHKATVSRKKVKPQPVLYILTGIFVSLMSLISIQVITDLYPHVRKSLLGKSRHED